MIYALGLSIIVHTLLILFNRISLAFGYNPRKLNLGQASNRILSVMIILSVTAIVGTSTVFSISRALKKDSNFVLISKLIEHTHINYPPTTHTVVYAATDVGHNAETEASQKICDMGSSRSENSDQLADDGHTTLQIPTYDANEDSLSYTLKHGSSFLNFNPSFR